MHTVPAPHVVPHAPQFAALAERSVSHPFAAFPSQSPNPAAHVVVHVPLAHDGTACGALAQTAPHAPQCAGLLRVSVSHPFAPVASQSPKPGRHANAHAPAMQSAAAFAGAEQVMPHAPQFVALLSEASHPFIGVSSQSPNPALHANPHVAPVHVADAFATVAHALPHAPQ
jgi:hypothetical protein